MNLFCIDPGMYEGYSKTRPALKTLNMQHLLQCTFRPEDQIYPILDIQ